MNVTLFGGPPARPSDSASDQSATVPLIEFLQGRPVEFTPELAAAVLAEFTAQESFRLKLRESMRAMVTTFKQQADRLQGDLQVPYRESEQYGAGYQAGRYAQATESAQLAQNVLNAALEEAATL